jgi:hypothetical protein
MGHWTKGNPAELILGGISVLRRLEWLLLPVQSIRGASDERKSAMIEHRDLYGAFFHGVFRGLQYFLFQSSTHLFRPPCC